MTHDVIPGPSARLPYLATFPVFMTSLVNAVMTIAAHPLPRLPFESEIDDAIRAGYSPDSLSLHPVLLALLVIYRGVSLVATDITVTVVVKVGL